MENDFNVSTGGFLDCVGCERILNPCIHQDITLQPNSLKSSFM